MVLEAELGARASRPFPARSARAEQDMGRKIAQFASLRYRVVAPFSHAGASGHSA